MIKKYTILTTLAAVSLSASCTEGSMDKGQTKEATNIIISGYIQKGPFITGTEVAIHELDGALNTTDKSFTTHTSNDQGNFNIECITSSEYAEFVAEGHYFNEIMGELSQKPLTLRALSKIDNAVNINILTTLQCDRIKSLIRDGKSFEAATAQSKGEVLELFGLEEYDVANFDDMDISKGGESNTMLLAVSSILQQDRSTDEMSELITKLANDLADDGVVGAQAQTERLKSSARNVKPAQVIENLKAHYAELGVDINISDFSLYIDFDGDGIVGNDMLAEGEKVTLSKTTLNVPCEGESYTIEIDSPIKLYLERAEGSTSGEITINTGTGAETRVETENTYTSSYEVFTSDLYDQISSVRYDATLNETDINITVRPLSSRGNANSTIYLYDSMGNEVATITINQQGDKDAPLPKLGKSGSAFVLAMASRMAAAFQQFNLAEQYYGANAEWPQVDLRINPSSSLIEECWEEFYSTIKYILQLKDVDAKQMSILQEVLDTFSALCYYHMVVAWGDVALIPNYDWYLGGDLYLARTDSSEILDSLKERLNNAIPHLEEKRNSSMDNANDLFFVSKDVARILLADIHIYLGEYTEAKTQLKSVIDNGFYELDNSNYSQDYYIDNLRDSKEVIFALLCNYNSRSVTISTPHTLPIFTYSDVMLSYAECLYKSNERAEAQIYYNKVLEAKEVTSCGDLYEDIVNMRKTLYNYSVGNFAFFKRNGIAEEVYNVQQHQLLLPIPQQEMAWNPKMTQNPGY